MTWHRGLGSGDVAPSALARSALLRRLLILGLLVLPLVAGVAALLARGSASADRRPDGLPPGRYKGSEPPGRIALPAFALREWDGTAVESSALTGKVVLVTFLETKCKEACPLIADQIAMALDLLRSDERRRVYALAISTHPRDDTPQSVREFLRAHRVHGKLHYLIGSESRLRPVWSSFYVLSALDSGNADTHSASVRVFNARGRWVATLHPRVDLTPTHLAHDVRVALRDL